MAIFVDTSALYALVDRDDPNHRRAQTAFEELGETPALATHSYALLEGTALLQRRLGPEAARALHDEIVPVVEVAWVDESLHAAAVTALLAASRRKVSLVDWVSFELMRRRGIETAFAFDENFRRQGFQTVP